MIKVAAKPPPERMKQSKHNCTCYPACYNLTRAVMEWRGKLRYEALPKVKAWGVEVNTQMMKIEARVLPAPSITYGGNKTLRAAFG